MPAESSYDRSRFLTELYDLLPVVTARRDLPFYQKMARETGGPVLELGSGTGRVLLPLAGEGHRVTGLDLSEAMLERCRGKLARLPVEERERVRLVQGDMTNFDLGELFPLVVIPFRPFQHLLEVEQQVACLRAVHRHLPEKGRLVLDMFHTDPRRTYDPAYLEESAPMPEFVLSDGRRVVMRDRVRAYHRAVQRNDFEFLFDVTWPDGRRERLVHQDSLRYFFRYEMEHLLARCGFRVAALYGNFDRSAFGDDSPEMIFVAESMGGEE
jgi:SAM-dependent methyltransferase